MITGDSKETAVAIAKQLNIITEDQDISKSCFTGNEFEKMTADQKKNILKGS
jgi:magnesium-transporting ATPase (P-type)